MSGTDIAVTALLAIGCAAVLLSVIGVLLARNTYEGIHYMGPASTLGIGAVTAAILLSESVNGAGLKAILIFLVTFISSAVLAHALARSVRGNQTGTVRVRPSEQHPESGQR